MPIDLERFRYLCAPAEGVDRYFALQAELPALIDEHERLRADRWAILCTPLSIGEPFWWSAGAVITGSASDMIAICEHLSARWIGTLFDVRPAPAIEAP